MVKTITITNERIYQQTHTSMINALNHMSTIVGNGGYCFVIETTNPSAYPVFSEIVRNKDRIKLYHEAIKGKDLGMLLKCIDWLDEMHEKQRIHALALLKRLR